MNLIAITTIAFVALAGWVISRGRREEPKPDDIDQPQSKPIVPPTVGDLTEWLRELGLLVDGLKIEVDGDAVKVAGTVASQELREKIVLALGNVKGIARVEDGLEVEIPAEPATFYTVQKGDNLTRIAEAHYGDGNKYPVIFEANTPMLSDPDKIYPGQVLRIPAEAA